MWLLVVAVVGHWCVVRGAALTLDIAPGDSVYDFWLRADPLPGSNPLQPNVPVLGSGSDHTAFIAHSGIAALDLFFEAKNDCKL